MRKMVIPFVVMMFLLTACSSEDSPVESVQLTKNTIVELSDFSFEILDFKLIESLSDPVQDSMNVYESISASAVELNSVQLGFDIGFNNARAEVNKRDGYLTLVLDYNPDENIKNQRDSIIPKMSIRARDNKGEDLILLHNSLQEGFIQVDNPVGILVFKTFADTTAIEIRFDDKPYTLDLK